MELIRTDFGIAIDRGPRAPIELRHIIGIGRNYADHAKEMGGQAPTRPVYFTKNPACACLDGDPIRIPAICRDPETGGPDQVDFEGELAVVIGERCRDVPAARALEVILGVCCANDVSARWWQNHGAGGQFCRGKSFDTFCPIGPRLVGLDHAGPLDSLSLTTRVSGEVMQAVGTDRMIFPVPVLIAELSRGTTLLPGTVILTGTPSGVGHGRDPKRYLRPGDTVEIEIGRIGVLRNPVVNA
jgi:2-keto-4-pentenoate hydratase/2-oxohepta-3-ene-1,7-dioic acid hydratase in catechol pathway